jgi:hypothetical protein
LDNPEERRKAVHVEILQRHRGSESDWKIEILDEKVGTPETWKVTTENRQALDRAPPEALRECFGKFSCRNGALDKAGHAECLADQVFLGGPSAWLNGCADLTKHPLNHGAGVKGMKRDESLQDLRNKKKAAVGGIDGEAGAKNHNAESGAEASACNRKQPLVIMNGAIGVSGALWSTEITHSLNGAGIELGGREQGERVHEVVAVGTTRTTDGVKRMGPTMELVNRFETNRQRSREVQSLDVGGDVIDPIGDILADFSSSLACGGESGVRNWAINFGKRRSDSGGRGSSDGHGKGLGIDYTSEAGDRT